MTTDEGGWTRISEITASASYQRLIIDIDDKGLAYSEVLIICDSSHIFDYVCDYSLRCECHGVNIVTNAFKFSGRYYVGIETKIVYFPFSFGSRYISNFEYLETSDFNIISHTSTCLFEYNNKPEYCGDVVSVKVPNGLRIEAFSDIESVLNLSQANNYYNYKFEVLVR